MQSVFPILEGPYLRDLLSQPMALADTLEGLRRDKVPVVDTSRFSRIVLTGMGSSLFALHPLQIRLVRAGLTAMMVETAELVHAQAGLLDEKTLVVAVSQSGRSAESLILLDLIAGKAKRPYVIGVTNTADSPLAAKSDAVVMVRAGAEFSVSCKTYVATLVALDWLGAVLTGEDVGRALGELGASVGAVEGYWDSGAEHVGYLAEQVRGLKHLFYVGRGGSMAAVGTGALTTKESTRFHAEGMSAPAFRHGPLEMVGAGLMALVFEGEGKTAEFNRALARDIGLAGGWGVLISEEAEVGVFRLPKVPERARAVVEILPVQMMTLALAAVAGREPGVFERATKVTVVA